MNNRIKLNDTLLEIVLKLSEGNFGAATVVREILSKGGEIDPDCGFGEPIFQLLYLDTYEIYGEKIWMLYKDVCGQNINKTLACLRAMQLGIEDETIMKAAIENRGAGINLDEICKQVQERLPNFKMG